MSVLKNHRRLSKYEFIRVYEDFYNFSSIQLSKSSARRYQYVIKPFYKALNKTFDDIMSLNSLMFAKKNNIREKKIITVKAAINDLYELNKCIVVYCNIMPKTFAQMCNWCSKLRREMELLHKMLDKPYGRTEDIIVVNYDIVKEQRFLSVICELHKILHGKMIKVPKQFANAESQLVIQLIDTAFISVMLANSKIPQDKAALHRRTNRLKKALTCLDEIEIPLLSIFAIQNYSNKVQMKLAGLLVEEKKLLNGVLESDRKRFKDLK